MQSTLRSKRNQGTGEAEAIIRRLFERVYSKGELHCVDELIAPDYVGKSTVSVNGIRGPIGLKAHVIALRTAFHGFTITIDQLAVVGDIITVRWTACGTQEREFLGVEPTCAIGWAGEEPHGTVITVTGSTTGTITGGKLRESEMVWDRAELRLQRDSAADPLHKSRYSTVKGR